MYGLVEDLIELTAYIAGRSKMPWIPYQEDGNWESYLPKYESQSDRFETHGCTVWGLQNQVETFAKRLYDTDENYAERFNYLRTPVVPGRGADPQKAYECARHDGLIDGKLLPMTDTLQDYLENDITGSLLAKGQYWLSKHEFMHEWLWSQKPQNWKDILRSALKTSPIGVQVTAWHHENGLYVSKGKPNNHWCLLYKIDSEGKMYVFDSYDHSKKVLHPDHDIGRAKRIWINRRTKAGATKQISFLTALIKRLMNKKTLLDICEEAIGTDPSPKDYAPDELACADSVCQLLRKLYPETPNLTGTYSLFEYLSDPKNGYERVALPVPETIILSPTGTGKDGTTGHVGIYMEDGVIASNDSGLLIRENRGKFLKNYTTATWLRKFKEQQGMPIYLFKRKV